MMRFFSNINSNIKYNITNSENIKLLLASDYFVAANPSGGNKYHIHVQKDMVELADAFGMDIAYRTEVDGINEAMQDLAEKEGLISGRLLDAVTQFEECKTEYGGGDISFLGIYRDMSQTNAMFKVLNSLYRTKGFQGLQKLCGRMAATSDISCAEDMVNQKIGKLIKEARLYPCYAKGINRQIEEYEAAMGSIKDSPCFSRETFAMLYVYLTPYVRMEAGYEKFCRHIAKRDFSELEIDK